MPADRTPRAPGRAPSANLRPAWKPGQSGNPAGRKPGNTLRKLLAEADVPDPKMFLLTVMHDKRRSMKLRVEAAKAVLPFVFPRLACTQIVPPPQGDETRRFTLKIFDPYNGGTLPPPDGDEKQDGSDDPT